MFKILVNLDTTLIGYYFGNSNSRQEVFLASPPLLSPLRQYPTVGSRVRVQIFRRDNGTGVDQTLALS
jgi:hypothetical protein